MEDEEILDILADVLYIHSTKFDDILIHLDYPLPKTRERELEMRLLVIIEIYEFLKRTYKIIPRSIFIRLVYKLSFNYHDILHLKYPNDEFENFILSREVSLESDIGSYMKGKGFFIYPYLLYIQPLEDVKEKFQTILLEMCKHENIKKCYLFGTAYMYMRNRTEKIITSLSMEFTPLMDLLLEE